MGMNNIYYRFTHLVHGDYATMPAKLRMNVMAKPGVDKVDFELWSLAVSAINGCGMCMEIHEKVVPAARPLEGSGAGRGPHRRRGACDGGDAGRRGRARGLSLTTPSPGCAIVGPGRGWDCPRDECLR